MGWLDWHLRARQSSSNSCLGQFCRPSVRALPFPLSFPLPSLAPALFPRSRGHLSSLISWPTAYVAAALQVLSHALETADSERLVDMVAALSERYHDGVCGDLAAVRDSPGFVPAASWSRGLSRATLLVELGGEGAVPAVPCLGLPSVRFAELLRQLAPPSLPSYGGMPRFAVLFVEALAEAVLGHAETCAFFLDALPLLPSLLAA